MAYTSGQYKYLLIRILQRMFSMGNSYDRAYTQNFFYALLDSSITINEEQYNNFIKAMDENVMVLAKKDAYIAENLQGYIGNNSEGEVLLIGAFKAIGITLKFKGFFAPNTAEFTKPDGSVLTYYVPGMDVADNYIVSRTKNFTVNGSNYFFMNIHSFQEYQYAKKTAIIHSLQNIEILNVDDLSPNVCGEECYWDYNPTLKTQTITGNGFFAGVPNEIQLNSGEYYTIIFSSTVKKVLDGSIWTKGEEYTGTDNKKYNRPRNCVFLHAENADIKITKDFCKSNYKETKWNTTTIYPQIVYTDCKKIIDELTGLDYITLKPLSEWEG